MEEPITVAIETGHQVAQAFTVRDLRVGHANKMAPRGPRLAPVVGRELTDQILKVLTVLR